MDVAAPLGRLLGFAFAAPSVLIFWHRRRRTDGHRDAGEGVRVNAAGKRAASMKDRE